MRTKNQSASWRTQNKNYKVAVGLSGGVDSAVSAALLKKAGFEVVGVYLHCFPQSFQKTLDCTDQEEQKMAFLVAKTLGIPFTFFDFEREYQEKVIKYFFEEYERGRTPNPDAVCNQEIKFGLFLEKAIRELGVDFVATGHYARIKNKNFYHLFAGRDKTKDQSLEQFKLLAGIDLAKDQSYFLYNLSQAQLSRMLFPVGEYTKVQVRKMAKEFGLPNWDRKDSQGICFLGKISVRKFLEQRLKPKIGEVVDTAGRVIGEHDGVWFYTIGQRHGFRVGKIHLRGVHSATSEVLSLHGPWYVVEKDIKNNRLIVGWGKECERNKFFVEEVNWINGKVKDEIKCEVRIRHLGELYPATLIPIWDRNSFNEKVEVTLVEPAWGVAPGQVAVFYQGEEVLGGGIIV